MAIEWEVCPFHAGEAVAGTPTDTAPGALEFTCDRQGGHPAPAPYSWVRVPAPPSVPGVDGLAADLGLHVELPAAVAGYRGRWVEYGVVERAYAARCPKEFADLVRLFGHNAVAPKQYTVSAYLAHTLGALSKSGTVLYHAGPATGRWSYNYRISWWTVAPQPDWETQRLSWKDTGLDMTYVQGAHADA